MSRPVVGRKELRSFAGALSFVAGVVPHLRPFLASLWVGKAPGKLVHTRRIGQALKWISAFLGGENSLTRVVMARRQMSGHPVITDASTFGMGGVLIEGDSPREFFQHPHTGGAHFEVQGLNRGPTPHGFVGILNPPCCRQALASPIPIRNRGKGQI